MKENEMNVLFSSDDNYAQHLGVAIFSLLMNNYSFKNINIYIVDNEITEINKEKLNSIVQQFMNTEIMWIPFEKWKAKLQLNMMWSISISSYARLFIADILPESAERVLYLDCDMIICSSLMKLWNADLHGCIIGAVQDTVSNQTKDAVGLLPSERYCNAGMLLIDLCAWRKERIGENCVQFIYKRNGSVVHHDQGTINGVLKGKWFRLPLMYNVMTIHYFFDQGKVKRYFNDQADFYSVEEIEQSKERPAILHYTPSFTTRPWFKNCKHPKKQLYWDMISSTPWREEREQRDNSKWYVKLINWSYRNLY